MRLSVLVSGRGSNLEALLRAIDQGQCPARVECVLSDREAAPALQLAQARGIATQVVAARAFPDRGVWDVALADALSATTPDLVVLAGFMRIVGPSVLGRFERRLINVHPSLLPAFPGMDAPAQAIAKGVALSGCTVHLVDGGVDTGPILAQAAVPVLPGDDAASLHARIQGAEHQLLPAVIAAIARGTLSPDRAGEPGALAGAPSASLPPTPAPFSWPRFSE
ncbi:MAG TPA: phosphoribosylglycinamide formyltransferase [Polyangiales bacterium]